jgi:hypothetical protein
MTPLDESPTQRPAPDNTQYLQETDIHAPGGIRTHNPNKQAAADLRLRPHCYWDQYFLALRSKYCPYSPSASQKSDIYF